MRIEKKIRVGRLRDHGLDLPAWTELAITKKLNRREIEDLIRAAEMVGERFLGRILAEADDETENGVIEARVKLRDLWRCSCGYVSWKCSLTCESCGKRPGEG